MPGDRRWVLQAARRCAQDEHEESEGDHSEHAGAPGGASSPSMLDATIRSVAVAIIIFFWCHIQCQYQC